MLSSARNIGLWLALAIAPIAPAASQVGHAAERKKLEGTWKGFVVERRGERPDRGPASLDDLLITAERISYRPNPSAGPDEGTYRLDPSRNPKHMDASGTAGQSRGKSYLGIYALEGDTLKWCVANPGRPRPTEFLTNPNVGQFLMILKRVRRP